MEASIDSKRECTLCGVQFNHRSSLIRHVKNNCNKNQSQRRKSCNQCIANKSKCNLKRPACSRCSLRNVSCAYDSPGEEQPEHASPGIASPSQVFAFENMPTFQPLNISTKFDTTLFDPFFTDFAPWSPSQLLELAPQAPHNMGLELLPFNDSVSCTNSMLTESGSNQRLGPSADSNSIALANHSMELIFRIFRTWPQMLADGFQIPPIFHSTHLASQTKLPQSLATCITLAKMWHGHCPGAEEVVRVTIRKELDLVIDKCDKSDETTLLASLQSVVIYTIILLAPSAGSENNPIGEEDVFRKVEIFVLHIVRSGLFLAEERAQTRPSWESWVYMTAKRRAILSLYLLHWAYSVLHKVPCFDCKDLGFMPAPAPKVLWQAHTEQEWNNKYIHWLARWSGHIYLQAEFGHIPPGATLCPRAEKWLGEADEFGFIMVSILNATEFEPPGYKGSKETSVA